MLKRSTSAWQPHGPSSTHDLCHISNDQIITVLQKIPAPSIVLIRLSEGLYFCLTQLTNHFVLYFLFFSAPHRDDRECVDATARTQTS